MSEVILCKCGCGQPAPIAVKTDRRRGHVKGQAIPYIVTHYGAMLLSGKSGLSRPILDEEITERDLENIREMDDLDAADLLDGRVQRLEVMTKRTFVELGLICLEMIRRNLWSKVIDPVTGQYYHSKDAWIMGRLGVSRSSAYEAMKILQMKDVSVADVREMPRVNASRLAGLSSEVQRDPKVIEAAKHASEKEFVGLVQELHPGQHVEQKRAVVMKPAESQRDVLDEVLEIARWAYEVTGREDAMENVCAYFLDGKCEREGFTNWTNREAFEAAKRRA